MLYVAQGGILMNSAERFFSAMRGETPDRVPIFELWVHPNIINTMVPGASWPEFVEVMGLDAISSLWIFDGTISETRLDEKTTIDEWGVTRDDRQDQPPISRTV